MIALSGGGKQVTYSGGDVKRTIRNDVIAFQAQIAVSVIALVQTPDQRMH